MAATDPHHAPSGPGIVLVAIAVAGAAFLGTIGSLVIGMGSGTDCTTSYPGAGDGYAPCRGVTIGMVVQMTAQAVLLVVAVRLVGRRRASVVAGLVLLHLSVGCWVVAQAAVGASYCRPGTAGYDASYCPGAPGPEDPISPPGSGSASPRA